MRAATRANASSALGRAALMPPVIGLRAPLGEPHGPLDGGGRPAQLADQVLGFGVRGRPTPDEQVAARADATRPPPARASMARASLARTSMAASDRQASAAAYAAPASHGPWRRAGDGTGIAVDDR